MWIKEYLRYLAIFLSAVGFVFFCFLGVVRELSLVNSLVALVGSIGCLVAYVKISYPQRKEAKI